MKKFYLRTLSIAVSFLLTYTSQAQNNLKSDDPDLPSFGNISKEEYLEAREDYINLRRGLPNNLPYNARLKAIAEMKQQEQLNKASRTSSTLAANWTELGPSPIPNGQTFTTTTPVSGRVTAIAIHPTDPNTVYVGTANGGIFRTTDGGASWTAIFDAASSLAIGALALAPSSPTTLFVGTGEANASSDSYAGIGLYRIDNASTSPSLVGPINPSMTFTGSPGFTTTAFGFRSISKILVHPTNPAIIFVSTYNGQAGNPGVSPSGFIPPLGLLGMYRSTNATSAAGSVTFTKLAVTTANSFDIPNTGNRRIDDMVMIPGNPNGIVCWVNGNAAVGDGGIYKTNNALAGTPIFTQSFITTITSARGNLAIIKQGTDTVIYAATGETAAGTSCATNSGAVRKSRDGGITWSAKLSGGGGFCGGQCFYDIAIDVAPNDSTKILLGGSAGSSCSDIVKRSADAGATFITSQDGLHADSHVIAFAPSNPSIVYTGNDGGIFKSTDGGVTWSSLNVVGFKATQFQSIALHPVDPNFTIGGTQDNGTNMLKPDGTFNRIDFGDGGYALIDQNAVDNNNVSMYHTYYNQTNNLIAYARSDVGPSASQGTWNVYGCNTGIVNGIDCSDATLFYAPMTLGPGNPNTVYFGTNRLYRSSDKGVTNVTVSQSPIVSGAKVSGIAVSKQNDNIRLVGLTNGQVWGTVTGSSTLTNMTPGSITSPVGRIAIDPSNSAIAYVTYDGYGLTAGQHVWKTINLTSGTPTWAAKGTGIPDVPVNAFAIDPSSSSNIYAGTDIGVYQSTDGGTSWIAFNTGLPIVPVFDMAIHPVTRVLKIATHGRGFFSTPLGIVPITWVGTTSNDWGTVSNWSPATVPSITSDVIIPTGAANMPVSVTGTKTCYNITIQTGASVTLTGILQIAGAVSNSGIFTASAGTIEMKGNSTQIVAANTFSNNTIANVIISNNAVVSAGVLNITDTLSFGNINNAVFSTSDLLTLKSSATNTAIFVDITNGGVNSGNSINGNVTVERFISAASARSAWRLLTAPLKSATGTNGTIFSNWQNGGVNISGKATRVTGPAYNGSNGLDASTNNPSMKWFDGITLQPITTTNNPSTTPLFTTAASAANNSYFTFIDGDRSAVFGSPSTTTLSATGNLQTGDQTFATNSTANGFTLVGNPYAAPIDLDIFRQNNSGSNIKTIYYIWDPYLTGTFGYGGYVTISYGGSSYTITPSGATHTRYLQSGQAMFVQTKSPASGTASVIIKETQKSATIVSNIFRTQSTQSKSLGINLNVLSSGSPVLVDGIVAEFDNSYSANVDDDDAYKLYNIGESIAFIRDSTALSIERRPLIKGEDVLNLNLVNLKANRNYQFEFTPELNAPAFKPFLKDNYLKKITPINVSASTTINFTVNSDALSKGANRFSIVFSNSAVYTNNPDIYIYPNPVRNGIINLQFNDMPQGNYYVRILNSLGQTILNDQINHAQGNSIEIIKLKNKVKGVYQLEIIKPDNSKFVKKVISD